MAKSSSSSDNEVYDDFVCSKSCRKNTENLNTKTSKLNEELSDCETDLPTPSIDVSKDVSDDQKAIWKINSTSSSEQVGSFDNVVSKPMIRNTSQSPKVMSSNFGPPIIEDWDSEDESEVNFTLNKTVRPSIEQVKFDKSTREVVGEKETPKQNKSHPRGNQRNWNNQKS
ncbi:hypothetical protein Tco_1546148 [Tanacetum coccineum]